MNKANGQDVQEDFIAEGFHRLDDNIVELKAPRLTEPPKFAAKSDNQKYLYYRKIAATMNHAAKLIQDERNALNELIKKKEAQLVSMVAQLNANNAMVQSEVARMNGLKQSYNTQIAGLNARIRELEDGSID